MKFRGKKYKLNENFKFWAEQVFGCLMMGVCALVGFIATVLGGLFILVLVKGGI